MNSEALIDAVIHLSRSRWTSWLSALVLGGTVFFCHFLQTPVGAVLGNLDPARYGSRIFVFVLLTPWLPGCGWYSWERPGGGCGRARWFWRHPKVRRWQENTSFVTGWG